MRLLERAGPELREELISSVRGELTWRFGLVVNVVGRINELNQHRAR